MYHYKCLFFTLFLIICFSVDATAQRARRTSHQQRNSQHTCIIDTVYNYDAVDECPEFPGGDLNMIRYINHNRRYPRKAYEKGIEGKVICSFIVNKMGHVSCVRVLRGVSEELNKEAVRVISNMPQWQAGKVNNGEVNVRCYIPITFRR